MVDHVLARDRTCRGLGCRLAADRCDLDHGRPWPQGPTSVDNLHPLCRFEHGVKTHTDTTVTLEPDGSTVWTYPSGHSYRRPPDPVIDHPQLAPYAPRRAVHRIRSDPDVDVTDPDGDVTDPDALGGDGTAADVPPF
jgi:hypothetical protein